MIDSTNPRVMADNIRHLTAGAQADEADIATNASAITANAAAIEALGTYSTEEIDTGMKFGDASIYRKIFNIEHLPNNTQISFYHEIQNLDIMVSIYGCSQVSSSQNYRPIPFSNNMLVSVSATTVFIVTNTDYSSQSAVLIIEYTKAAAPSPDLAPAPDDSRSIEPEVIEDPETRSEAPEEVIEEEPVVETKSTRKKSTSTK